ncbi:MAG: ferredoxin:protochlorophyllide reductase (ATP-dependent) subunit B [Pseudomonadota bacterium]
MKLTLWTYEGPTHMGAMRIADSMENVHYVLHAPQGDTYADLLFTMIERSDHRPPVTYTTFQARDLGGDTAGVVQNAVRAAAERFKPDLMLVGESCTAELIQDQPATLALGLGLSLPIVPLELPSYSRKENFGASETLYHIVRSLLKDREVSERTERPSVNLLGPSSLGFRSRDNVIEVERLLESVGIAVNVCAPLGASPADLERLPQAWANLCLYPEVAETTARWLNKQFKQPMVTKVPIGVSATQDCLKELCELLSLPPPPERSQSRLPWYSRSVDSTYLTGKRVFVFGDATHACAAARIARDELGFEVVGLGTYSREFARGVRALAKEMGLTALITEDYLEVEQVVTELSPELVLGTQMERHIAKRLGVPCALISAPFHVQDCPARYSPTMGWEGANVLFDSWVHPLMMGLEEHLLGMFREDFEFGNGAVPSHLHNSAAADSSPQAVAIADSADDTPEVAVVAETESVVWTDDAVGELKKIPFFVRGKARNNTERFAVEQGVAKITVETLYDAKAHFSR